MQSEQIDKLAEALSLAQKDMTLPKKNREVTVKTNSGTNYQFEYTTLDAIIEHVRQPLTANGLWFVQIIEHDDAKTYLDTSLVHKSGQWIKSRAQIAAQAGGRAQEFGSALTYMRRYALSALLGIASEEDDDANAADGNTIAAKRDRQNGNGHTDKPPLQRPKTPDQSAANAAAWARGATEAVNAIKTGSELRKWELANEKELARLKLVDYARWGDLNNLIGDRLARLSPANA